MRAHDLLRRRTPESRKVIAQLLRLDSTDVDPIAVAMRSPTLLDHVLRHCHSPLMHEDLALLCANPFDAVRSDELVEAAMFERIGLLESTGRDTWSVNLDMALTLQPFMPLEFGYAATLLSRLDAPSLASVARSYGFGPRPNHIDHLLDIAQACVDEHSVMEQVARLNRRERLSIIDALDFGELPDDPSLVAPDAAPPAVTLDAGDAGKRGLVFWIEQPSTGLENRPVVVLELLPRLQSILDRVPMPPETISTKAAPKRTRRASTGTRTRTPAQSVDAVPAGYAMPEPTSQFPPTPQFRRIDEPVRPSYDSRMSAPVRAASVSGISGVVDVEEPRFAEAALRDPDLRPAMLEVVAETLVVIRAGYDPSEWAERFATRFNFT
jgi:hypothetical protein